MSIRLALLVILVAAAGFGQIPAELLQQAKNGDAEAQGDVALRYYIGILVSKDFKEAAYWYRKAAEQGDASCQSRLGRMYQNGEGVARDFAQAVYWFKQCAERGHTNCQIALGGMYVEGKGVSRDLVLAYMWRNISLAKSTGDIAKMIRELLNLMEKDMAPDQIAEAQLLTRQWRPKK